MKAKRLFLLVVMFVLAFGLFACGRIKVSISGDKTVEVGKTIVLTAETSASGAAFSWSSSDNSIATVNNGTVTGVKEGKVTITVIVESGSKSAEASIEITVTKRASDNAPVITGASDKTIEKGSTFVPLQGVTATDVEDGDLTSKIKYSGNVKTGAVGTYQATYTVTDSDGNTTSVTITVTVVFNDKDAPLLTGINDKAIIIGDTAFKPSDGVVATDGVDGDVTSKIQITGSVDPWTLGEYTLTYSVKDEAGNEKTATRKITVGFGEFKIYDDDLEEKTFVKEENDYKFAIALEEIDDKLADFALAKLVFKVNATAACELVPAITNGTAQPKIALAAGDNDVVVYFRINAAITEGFVKLTAPADAVLEFSDVKLAFGQAKDTTAPQIKLPLDENNQVVEMVLPGSVTDVEALKKFVLTGVEATDNIDGTITSKLDVDFTGIELGNCFEEKDVTIFVLDSSDNRTEVTRHVKFLKVYDTKIITDPEFNTMPEAYDPETHIGWGLNGGSGNPELKVVDGELVHHNTTNDNPGWDSASSPFYRTTTEILKPFNWYMLKFDVKAEKARKMTVRIGLETTEALGWIENFEGGKNTPFNLTTEWQTCYVVFYVHAAKSQGNMDVAKIELKIGTFTWGGEEQGNTVYFDNLQLYLLSNENTAPELTIDTDLPTTFGKGEAKPDLTKYVKAHDLEDAADIAITAANITEAIDMSKAGTYDVVYKVADSTGKEATITLQIKVLEEKDTAAPVFTEAADLVKTFDQFGTAPDLTKFVTINDNIDGAIAVTSKMIETTADINVAGTYEVKYTVKDSSGNEATHTITITVNDKEAPKVSGKATITVVEGTVLTAEDIIKDLTVTDNVDENIALTADCVKDLDKVDFTKLGENNISVEISDAAGNKATFAMKIVIKEDNGEEVATEIHDYLQDELVGENADVAIAEGVMTIDPTDVGQWASYAKIKVEGMDLEYNKTYELRITAKADEARRIIFRLGVLLGADPWFDDFTFAEEGAEQIILGTEYKEYVVRFKADKDKGTKTIGMEFQVGNSYHGGDKSGNKIYVTSFKLFEIKEGTPFEVVKTIDFMDGTVGSPYDNTAWKREKFTTDWAEVTGQMNCREKDGVRVVNFTTGYSMTLRYTFNENGDPLGEASKMTFKAGNYFSPQEDILVKIIIVDTEGNRQYALGSSDEFVTFAKTDGLIDQEVTFNRANVQAIVVVVKGAASANQYLYVGDIKLWNRAKPGNVDETAPVITISDAVTTALASKVFVEGADESATFTAFLAGISATDDKDGEIAITQDMVDLGGLNPAALVAGDYTITITVADAAGNEAKKEVKIKVAKLVVKIDFMDGTVGSQYTSADWKQEKYTTAWEATSGQMNCREKDGVRVVNFVSGYGMTTRFTYSKTDAVLGVAYGITFKIGNYFTQDKTIPTKIFLVDGQGNNHYLIGSAQAFEDYPYTTGLDFKSFLFDEGILVKALVVVCKYPEQSNNYLYLGDIQLLCSAERDTGAPSITIPEGDITIPGDLNDEALIKKFILTGVTASDEIEGDLTSKIAVDLSEITLGNCFEEKSIELSVADSSGNDSVVNRKVLFAKTNDTYVISDPEFYEDIPAFDADTKTGWGLNGGSGEPVLEVKDGALTHHNTVKANPGWDSASSPFFKTTTATLKSGNWYLLKYDVKAEKARKMTVRIGLETTEALGWIENFEGGKNVPFNITTDWQTCYVLFYVHADKSQGDSDVIKFEFKIGTFTWGGEEQENVVYFDNLQVYLLTNEAVDTAPVVTLSQQVQAALATKEFTAGADETATFQAFLAGITATDAVDGNITVTAEMVDMGGLNPAALVAGDYLITVAVPNSKGLVGKLHVVIKVQ